MEAVTNWLANNPTAAWAIFTVIMLVLAYTLGAILASRYYGPEQDEHAKHPFRW